MSNAQAEELEHFLSTYVRVPWPDLLLKILQEVLPLWAALQNEFDMCIFVIVASIFIYIHIYNVHLLVCVYTYISLDIQACHLHMHTQNSFVSRCVAHARKAL